LTLLIELTRRICVRVSGGAGGKSFANIQHTIFLLIVFAPRLELFVFVELERISVAVHFGVATRRAVKLKGHLLLKHLVTYDALGLLEGFCF